MNDELKTQITALRTAIMRRVEFDQCVHASSIEDEIGKWVREVFAETKQPKFSDTTIWSDQITRMLKHKRDQELLQSIYGVAMDSTLYGRGYMLDGKHVPAQQVTATEVRERQREQQHKSDKFLKTLRDAADQRNGCVPAKESPSNPTWLRTTYPTKTVTRTDAVAPGPQKLGHAPNSRYIDAEQHAFTFNGRAPDGDDKYGDYWLSYDENHKLTVFRIDGLKA